MTPMTSTKPNKGLLRWATFLAAAMLFGPGIGYVAARITPVPGGVDGTALLSAQPLMGVLAMVMCVGVAGTIGAIAARFVSIGQGLTCMGVALAWACFQTGHLPGLARAVDPASLSTRLAIEGAVLGLLVLAAAAVLSRHGWPDEKLTIKSFFSGQALAGALVTTAAGLCAAWLIAQDDKPGQTLAASIAAGAVGAAIARTVVHAAPRSSTLLAIPLGAIACPLIGFAMTKGNLETAILGGTVSPLARIMPIDWCAGMLIGLPFGLSWAGSMIEKAQEKPGAARPASVRA